MNEKTKTIHKLLVLSIIFHAIYIGFEMLMIAFQIPISTKFLRGNGEFIFPTILFTFDMFRFFVHIIIVVLIKQQLKNNVKKRVLEIVSIILYGGVFAFIYSIGNPILKQYIARQEGVDYMGNLSQLASIVGIGSDFYRLAFLLLIIACSMAWYYKKYVILERQDIPENVNAGRYLNP